MAAASSYYERRACQYVVLGGGRRATYRGIVPTLLVDLRSGTRGDKRFKCKESGDPAFRGGVSSDEREDKGDRETDEVV
jgi:hypothetical protein